MIHCDSITRTYEKGSYPALRGVSFEIAAGDFIAIMGPSGCGKSTLLNILGLLDHPTSGRYRLDGTDVSKMSDLDRTLIRRQKIGFVFQAFNLLPRLTALENVCLPMTYAGVSREERAERARELLVRVGLGKKTAHSPLELSGGERQRVGIARALANRPFIVLADEPTGNLDSRSSQEILEFFQELHREKVTMVLVTHDPKIAEKAHRTLRIRDGLLE